MALFKEVKSLQLIPSYLVQPLKANASVHLAMSQVDLLSRLLRDLGTENSGFTVDNVMKVSQPRASGLTLAQALQCKARRLGPPCCFYTNC